MTKRDGSGRPACPFLPPGDASFSAVTMRTVGADRGEAFYHLALRCALDAEEKLRVRERELNARRAAEGLPVTSVYLGLHIGDVFYGNIGSEERLVVEACGTIEGVSICEQRIIETSPKRILFAEDLTYPVHGQYERGAFDFAFRMERQAFESDAWEPLPDVEIDDAYLVATVEGKPETSVRVPVDAARGRFDLSRYENFPEFEFRMIRGLKNGDAVPVRLELFAGLSGDEQRLASLERIVREKSREERESEMEEYVRLAVERLLEAFEPYDHARAWVRDWRFDSETRQYDVHVKVAWDGRHSDRGELDGNLLFREDGTSAVFERDDLNRMARRLWRRQIGEDRVMLGSLKLNSEESEPAVAENVIHEITRRF